MKKSIGRIKTGDSRRGTPKMFTIVKFWGRRLAGPVLIMIFSLFVTFHHASALTHQEGVGLEFTFNPTLNVSLSSSDLSIDNLSPGNYAYSNTINVNVSTNNSTGYSLSAKVGNDSTYLNDRLISSNNGYFTNLSSIPTLLSDFNDNEWGYTLASSNDLLNDTTGTMIEYTGLVYNTNTIINATTDINGTPPTNTNYTGTNTTNFTIGARASVSQTSGTYSNVITFTAVANPITTVSLYDSYKYYNKTKHNGYFTMQDMTNSICKMASINSKLQVIDTRDDSVYWIAKLKDNNCWMIQNLRLGEKTSSLELTKTSSNVNDGGFILNGKTTTGKFTSMQIDGVNEQNNNSQYYCSDNYGCYYNWYTATAGTGTTATTQNTTYNICPSKWTLPSGWNGGQLHTLYGHYNSAELILVNNPTTTSENAIGEIPGFLLSGKCVTSGVSNAGTGGYYWSRTPNSTLNARSLNIYSSSVSITNSRKYEGYSVRCLAK